MSMIGCKRLDAMVTRGQKWLWRLGGGIILDSVGSSSFSSLFHCVCLMFSECVRLHLVRVYNCMVK